jgi:predicted RNA binding protein YcfA (HicA-like mRNA interferase family)
VDSLDLAAWRAKRSGAMKVRDVIKMLEREGWRLRRQRGSHRQYVHPERPGKVTVAGHESKEMARSILESIRRQAGLK